MSGGDPHFLALTAPGAPFEIGERGGQRQFLHAPGDLNTMIESFPTNFIANYFKFEKQEFFEIGDAAAREVPRVDFSKK